MMTSDAPQSALEEARLRGRELDRALAAVNARSAAKKEAVARLLGGRATLRQTIACFREIGSAPLLDGSTTPGDDVVCDALVAYAELLLLRRPEGARRLALADLRRQVRDYLPGTVLADRIRE
jgi:hypothetical protein